MPYDVQKKRLEERKLALKPKKSDKRDLERGYIKRKILDYYEVLPPHFPTPTPWSDMKDKWVDLTKKNILLPLPLHWPTISCFSLSVYTIYNHEENIRILFLMFQLVKVFDLSIHRSPEISDGQFKSLCVTHYYGVKDHYVL